jgi:membrane protein implicated in regulation of membrane protease activity
MKKIKVSIPSYMAMFYYPIALLFLGLLAGCMTFLGAAIDNMWVKVPLLTVGGLLQLIGLAAASYMAYVLGKSILEDMKKGKADDKR